MTTVVCVKWGTAYGPNYVNRLKGMVARQLARPHRFVCLTDDGAGLRDDVEVLPLPEVPTPKHKPWSPWRKLALFQRQLHDLTGTCLFLDLDVVIVDRLDPFFEHEPGRLCIIENWTQAGRGIGNSSVFRFEVGAHPEIYDNFVAEPDRLAEQYDNEQTYFTLELGDAIRFWPEAWCKSFKRHCLPKRPWNLVKTPTVPEGCRIVVFHGHPKPDEAAAGRWPEPNPLKHVRPTPWIQEHWRE
ncbi:MAG: hypothetical protein GVY27_12845 [Deinococcus-Thermus bacterium]|jgi:hypothetical protein|nr:hypothetical protein [Deinococcota bacterium]